MTSLRLAAVSRSSAASAAPGQGSCRLILECHLARSSPCEQPVDQYRADRGHALETSNIYILSSVDTKGRERSDPTSPDALDLRHIDELRLQVPLQLERPLLRFELLHLLLSPVGNRVPRLLQLLPLGLRSPELGMSTHGAKLVHSSLMVSSGLAVRQDPSTSATSPVPRSPQGNTRAQQNEQQPTGGDEGHPCDGCYEA